MVAQAVAQPRVRLFPRQLRFVKDARRFPGYVGGIGSGKSFAGAAKVVGRINDPDPGIVGAPTYPMLRDATMRTLMELFDALGIEHRLYKAEHIIRVLRTGHEILCRSFDNPDAIRGPNVGYLWMDEASLVTREAWNIGIGRVRVGDRPQAWATFTPKGRNWCWEVWERDATGNEFDPEHPLYRVRTAENPELPIGFADSLGYAGLFADQELGGEFVAFEGLVYPAFNRPTHVMAVDCDGWGTVLAVDVGTRNPTAILTVRHSGDRIHVERELYRREMGSTDIVAEVASEDGRVRPEFVVVDPSAAGIIKDLDGLGIRARKAENAVVMGVSRVMSALASLTIDPSCVNTIAEFESYQYPQGAMAGRDAPIKANDHSLDALRYAVMELVEPPNPTWTDIDPSLVASFLGA